MVGVEDGGAEGGWRAPAPTACQVLSSNQGFTYLLVTWNSRDGTWPFGSRIVAVGFQKIFMIIFRAGFRYIVRYTLLT